MAKKAATTEQPTIEQAEPVMGTAGATDSGTAAVTAEVPAQAPPAPPAPAAQPPAAHQVDPAVLKAAAAAGIDVADLDEDEIQELLAAVKADQARAATVPIVGGKAYVREANGKTDTHAISLMLEACDIYGVNPSADQRPVELLAWKFYPGQDDPVRGIGPDAVVIVTGGGLKLKHYDDPDADMDPDTVDRLRRVFGLFKQDPKTKDLTVLDMPGDLTLPAAAVNGTGTTDHRYEGGYVKSGGKKAAADKAKRREDRARRMGLVPGVPD